MKHQYVQLQDLCVSKHSLKSMEEIQRGSCRLLVSIFLAKLSDTVSIKVAWGSNVLSCVLLVTNQPSPEKTRIGSEIAPQFSSESMN